MKSTVLHIVLVNKANWVCMRVCRFVVQLYKNNLKGAIMLSHPTSLVVL